MAERQTAAVGTTAPWNPWRALRERRHVLFEMHEVAELGGGALVAERAGRVVIVISPHLPRRERWAALAHELVHDERGVLAPGTPAPLVAKEEAAVRAEVARRLVPIALLAPWVAERSTVEPISAELTAEEFDVPVEVAAEALRQLRTYWSA